jgi:GNAT superfamily N-acetyltransferase
MRAMMKTLEFREARDDDLEQFAELKWRHYDGHYPFSAAQLRENPAERYVVADGTQILAAAEPKTVAQFPEAIRLDIFGTDADAWALLAAQAAELFQGRAERLISVIREEHASVALLKAAGYRLSWRSWAAHLYLQDELPTDAFAEVTARPLAEGFTVHELAQGELSEAYELYDACHPELQVTPATPNTHLDAQQFARDTARERVFVVMHENRCVAMTEVELLPDAAETNLTLVAPDMRGRGLATLVKAAAVRQLAAEGVREFGAGGGCPADSIMHVNRKLGFETELWGAYELALTPMAAAIG